MNIKTLIEKDSPFVPLVIIGALMVLLLLGAIGMAYVGGVFTGQDAVERNDRRIRAAARHDLVPAQLHALGKPVESTADDL